MKNLLMLPILFSLFNTSYAQNNNTIKNNHVKISEHLTLFQEKADEEGKLTWKLFIENKKEGKTTLLSNSVIQGKMKSTAPLQLPDNTYLDIPDLIGAFADGIQLYVFLYIEKAMWLYRYSFEKDGIKSERIRILNLIPGSMDNFGVPVFEVNRFLINKEYYFKFNHSRVVGKIEMLARFDKDNFVLKEIVFQEPVRHIKDEKQLFQTLDLTGNTDKIGREIMKVLIAEKQITENDDFEYLGNISLTDAYHYFFYKVKGICKIIRYNSHNSEWLQSDYKEEQVIFF